MLGYGIGDFGFNFYWFSLQLFLAYYYTDVLGLRAEVAGLIIFLCLTWDGLVDPAIGVLANRTRTRWGKYRPYLLFGSIPLAVSFALMFAPDGTRRRGADRLCVRDAGAVPHDVRAREHSVQRAHGDDDARFHAT